MSQFGIHSFEVQSGIGTIDGRCYRGRLARGAIFLVFDDPTGVRTSIRLEVIRIESYNHEFEEIEEGLTARLHVRGDGWAYLRNGGVLGEGEDATSTCPAE